MLSRLRAYGFEENTLNLLRSHLTDRQNSVKLGPVTINCMAQCEQGMPSGICPWLGPLLWNIFQNDLTYEIKSDVSMYADDHQLYEIGEDLAKVKSSLSAGNAEKASRWYEVNRHATLLPRNGCFLSNSISYPEPSDFLVSGATPAITIRFFFWLVASNTKEV